MNRSFSFSWLVLLAACGGNSGPAPADTATTPEGAVRAFMLAVSDSSITRMGRYWGTTKGPAGLTHQPSDYERRLVIMQSFLRSTPYRVLREDPITGDDAHRNVQVSLDRTDLDGTTCARTVNYVVARTNRGWIVSKVDLVEVGTPGRSCTAAKPATAPAN